MEETKRQKIKPMNIQAIVSITLTLFSAASWGALQQREYNTWYIKNAVLYDMTQTAAGMPVMFSLSQPGRKTANMLVSYLSEGACLPQTQKLRVNGREVPAAYRCSQYERFKIEHFAVKDAKEVNAIYHHLESDFTLLLQHDIKVWAANIKAPKFGIAPRF